MVASISQDLRIGHPSSESSRVRATGSWRVNFTCHSFGSDANTHDQCQLLSHLQRVLRIKMCFLYGDTFALFQSPKPTFIKGTMPYKGRVNQGMEQKVL